MKPYEIEVIIAEIGLAPEETKIYRIQFDGTLRDIRRFGAMGGMEEELASRLEDSLSELPDLAQAVRVAADTIEGVLDTSIAAEDWEGAVLDRNLGRRKFRRLAAEEIASARS
jgi:proteasome alpha subunit